MPKRMIRDWTDSERVNQLTTNAEVFLHRLMMKADDYGSYYSNVKLIKATLFPFRVETITDAEVSGWITECEKIGVIIFYDADDKRYIRILKFGQRMRNTRNRFPDCPEETFEQIKELFEDSPKPAASGQLEQEGETRKEIEGEDMPLTIELCLQKALKDDRWRLANQATEGDLLRFNGALEKQGIYKKPLYDYKKHYGNWRKVSEAPYEKKMIL